MDDNIIKKRAMSLYNKARKGGTTIIYSKGKLYKSTNDTYSWNSNAKLEKGFTSHIIKIDVLMDLAYNDFLLICKNSDYKQKAKQIVKQINKEFDVFLSEMFKDYDEDSQDELLNCMDILQDYLAHDVQIMKFAFEKKLMYHNAEIRKEYVGLMMCRVNVLMANIIHNSLIQKENSTLMNIARLIQNLIDERAKTDKGEDVDYNNCTELRQAERILQLKIANFFYDGDNPKINN